MKQVHIVVSGKVQGVGFRYYAQTTALSQGITGWVKNLPDGTVEILAEGKKDIIDNYLTLIKAGSPFSHVQSITVKECNKINNFNSFTIKY